MPPRGGPGLTKEQRHRIGLIAAVNKDPKLRGINICGVARLFHVTPKAARKWLLEGLEPHPNYSDMPRYGRPPKLQQLQKNGARRHARHHDTSNKIKERLERLHGIVISRSTVARMLRSGRNPLRWRTITRGKVLNPANIPKRLAFCKEHLHDDFSRYVFVDQFDDCPSYDKLGSATHSWQEAHALPAGPLGRPWAFRMYAAVGQDFKSPLLFVAPSPPEGTKEHKSKETFTAQGYISMMQQLKPHLDARYPDGDYVIIQDHAPQHTAKVSKQAT
jgi:transposase